jgi:hypothetical protein
VTAVAARTSWRLVHDAVLPFGPVGVCAVLHVRAFEAGPDVLPVVIVGQFGDYVGHSLTNAIEHAAAAAQTVLYPDGRRFRLVQHTPYELLHDNPIPFFREVTFARRERIGRLRRWARRRHDERAARFTVAATVVTLDGATRHVHPVLPADEQVWRFVGPSWCPPVTLEWPAEDAGALTALGTELIRPAAVRLPALLGDTAVQVWPKALYVPALIGGPDAAALAKQRAEDCHRRTGAEGAFIDALADPPPGAIVDLAGGVPTDPAEPDTTA